MTLSSLHSHHFHIFNQSCLSFQTGNIFSVSSKHALANYRFARGCLDKLETIKHGGVTCYLSTAAANCSSSCETKGMQKQLTRTMWDRRQERSAKGRGIAGEAAEIGISRVDSRGRLHADFRTRKSAERMGRQQLQRDVLRLQQKGYAVLPKQLQKISREWRGTLRDKRTVQKDTSIVQWPACTWCCTGCYQRRATVAKKTMQQWTPEPRSMTAAFTS